MEETIEFIYELVRHQNLNIGSSLELRPIITEMNPVIRNNIEPAFDSLVQQGIFENINGTLRLTQFGFETIFGNLERQMEETIEFIYELVRHQNLNIGSFLELRPIITEMNPVIRNNIEPAFDSLVQQGIFENINENFRLTQLGFETIFR